MSKIIASDEGQGESERVEVLARRIGRNLPHFRAGVEIATNDRKAKQAAADKKRAEGLKAAAIEDGFDGVSGMNTALIKRTHRVYPRLDLVSEKYTKILEAEAGNGDYEVAHINADAVLCDLLKELGLRDVCEAFEKVHKWYA